MLLRRPRHTGCPGASSSDRPGAMPSGRTSLRRDGIDGGHPPCGIDHAQRLILERRALDPVAGMVGDVARARDEQTILIQRVA